MYLVDTNILSEPTKAEPSPRIMEWWNAHEPMINISAVCLGEMHYGIELLNPGRKQSELRAWLRDLRAIFADSILPIDDRVALRWGALRALLDRQGRKMPVIDSLLAATALEHGLTLVTANIKDFAASGVEILNPQ